VDWKNLGLFDYPQIVKKPMDLGHIKRKIEKGEYATLHDAAQDVRLVWDNCKAYNADGSDFFILADNLSKTFEEKYAKLLKELKMDDKGSSIPEPSIEDKKKFAKSLYKITKEELGKVIIDLDTICPDAITKNNTEDQVEINVDNISPEAFQKVMEYVNGCIDGAGSRKKKTAPSNSGNKAKKGRS
jgi:hypothetical protein